MQSRCLFTNNNYIYIYIYIISGFCKQLMVCSYLTQLTLNPNFIQHTWVPIKCEAKQKRNEINENETKSTKTKRNENETNEINENKTKQKMEEKIIEENKRNQTYFHNYDARLLPTHVSVSFIRRGQDLSPLNKNTMHLFSGSLSF